MSIHVIMTAWRKRPWLGLAFLTLLAAVLRLVDLESVPPGFHYDEALEALEAWRVITRPDYHPVFFPGDFGLPAMFIYLESFAFRLFGALPTVSRSVAALSGALTIPAVYALGRELTLCTERLPRGLPFAAAAVLAVLRWHITFSRAAIEPILVPLFLTATLWALLAGLRTDRKVAWLGLAAALGLSVYTYPAAWLIPPLAGMVLLYLRLVAPQRLTGRGHGLAFAALLATLLAAPLAAFFLQHPELATLRSSQVAIIGAGRPLADSARELGGNLLKTLGMFSIAGDADPRSNIPGRPALDILMAIPFYLGIVLAARRWKQPANGILLLAGAAMLLTTVFSEYAPHFRRTLGLTPVVALLSGLGLATIWELRIERPGLVRNIRNGRTPRSDGAAGVAQASVRWRLAGAGLATLILLGSAVWNIRDYFIVWGHSPDLFYAYDEGLWQIGQYVKTRPADEAIYISPRPASDATLAFAWRAGPTVRHFDGRAAFIAPASAGRTSAAATYIIIEHEDFRGAGLLKELCPDAEEVHIFRDRNDQVYARAWHVAADAVPGRRPTEMIRTRWPAISLLGYDLNEPVYHPGEIVYLQLWWRAVAAPTTDWTVFTHLLGPAKEDGSIVWAGHDGRPGGGSVATTTWRPGELILDEHQIQLPTDMPPGEYEIEVGLYDPADANLRAISSRPRGEDAILLGKVLVQ